MKHGIAFLLIALLAASCNAPIDRPAAPDANAVQVDMQAKKKNDVGVFVDNNAKSIINFAMKFAKSDDLSKGIKFLSDPASTEHAPFLQPDDLHNLYAERGYQPIFTVGGRLADDASALVSELERLEAHGLSKSIEIAPWMEARAALASMSEDMPGDDFTFTPEEKAVIVDLIIAQNIDVTKIEQVRKLVADLVKDDTHLPRLHKAVTERADRLHHGAHQTALADVLTADLAMRFAREMAFENMTHLTDAETDALGKTPTATKYKAIAAARTRFWMKSLIAVLDAPAAGLRQKTADEAVDPHDGSRLEALPENAAEALPPDVGDGEVVVDVNSAVGVDEKKDAHETEAKAADALKQRVSDAQSVKDLVDMLYPFHPGYRQLMAAREKYAAMQDWAKIDSTKLVRGRANKRVPDLKRRLAIEGYFHGDTSDAAPDIYDDEIRAAVKFYHDAHQLAYDEEKGLQKGFWQSLNTPRMDRIAQIDENLRRWHHTQTIRSPYYIFINVPDFHGEIWRDGVRAYRFPIVAGNAGRACDAKTKQWKYINATPLMHARMLYLEYNPYWIVPPRIEQEEYIEKINADPTWLQSHGFEYYTENGRTVLRQLPSEKNALGRVKFIFPNPHSTFLHDSPLKGLFRYPVRAFSHGCMRVWEPLELAKRLLQYDGQWKDSIAKDIDDLENRRIYFKTRFDVFIDYYTVRVDDDGIVYFLADPYHYVKDAIDPPSARSLECKPNPKAWIPRTSLQSGVGADVSGVGAAPDSSMKTGADAL